MPNDPRLKQAMDAMDWFTLHQDWIVRAASHWYSAEMGRTMFDKMRELDSAREHLRQMYVGPSPNEPSTATPWTGTGRAGNGSDM